MSKNLANWTGCLPPQRKVMEGRYVRLEPLDPAKHGEGLYEISTGEGAELRLKYISQPVGQLGQSLEEFRQRLEALVNTDEAIHFAVIDKATGKVNGRQAFSTFDPRHGVVELSIIRGPLISRKPAGTEAFYLFAKHVFDELKYRRLEWKCHKDNSASLSCALRLGFTLEGILRQYLYMRNEFHDGVCFSMLHTEWSAVKAALELWLHPDNFNENGTQKKRLEDIMLQSTTVES